MKLRFYKRPFHRAKFGAWVYDANNNFVFQFDHEFDEDGMLPDETNKLQKHILDSLNSDIHAPIKSLNLSIVINDPTIILNNNEEFITVRGWGNLTGVGAHNLTSEEAIKIQDDFRDWLFEKLQIISE